MEKSKEMLEKEIDKLDEEIDSLYDKKNELYRQIRELEAAKYAVTNNTLGIQKGSCVIALFRSWDYHCAFMKMFKITHADKHEFKYIESTYRTDDSDISFRIKEDNANVYVFHNLLDEYDFITVSEENYNKILLECCKVNVDYDNKKEFFATVMSYAMNSIIRGK